MKKKKCDEIKKYNYDKFKDLFYYIINFNEKESLYNYFKIGRGVYTF